MNLVIPIAVTALLGVCLGYPVLVLARFFNLIDVPGSEPHKIHKFPAPLAGGLLMILILWISALIFHDWFDWNMLVIFISSTVIFLFGIWDDKESLPAVPKLLGQFIAVVILISQGIQIHFMDTAYQSGYISLFVAQVANIFLTFFWIIGITNAVNMIDSMGGIVTGIGMIAFLSYLYLTNLAGQEAVSVWCAVLLGICAGLYFWNKILEKIFLGDSGSQTLGFFLATLGILYNPGNFHPESSWFLPVILMGVPIFDTTLVVISRLRKGQPIELGRRDHTYHRLISLGLSSGVAVFITHLVALLLSGLAFFTLFLSPSTALTVFFVIVFVGIFILIWFERKPTLDRE